MNFVMEIILKKSKRVPRPEVPGLSAGNEFIVGSQVS